MSGETEMGVYLVVVKTSDRFDAGTDANVFIGLGGEDGGDPPEIHLKESLNHQFNNFQRNKKDLFQIQAPLLPQVSSLIIWHDNTGPNPSWHLEKVQVYDTRTNTIHDFPCNRWLSKDEDDGMIALTLPCQQTRKGPPEQFPQLSGNSEIPEKMEGELPPIVPQQEMKVMMWPGGYGYGGYPYYGGYGYGGYPYYGGMGYGMGYGGMGYGGMGYGMGGMWGRGMHSWSWSW